MNKLLIGIAQRLVHKAIEVNTEEYNVKVAVLMIGNVNSVMVTIFNEVSDNKSFWFYGWFYDDNTHNRSHISQFRCILRKIRKRVL